MKRFIFRFSQFLIWLYFSFMFRIEVRGADQIPRRGRLLLAANHISGYDPPLIGSVIPRVAYFMAKKELFRNPLLGALLRFYHCIPVDRAELSPSTIRRVSGLLQHEQALLMFPEGTRTRTGAMLELKAGIGMLACATRSNIMPVRIDGLFNVRGSFRKRPKVTVTFGQPVDITPYLQNGRAGREIYVAIAAQVSERIRSLAPAAHQGGP